MRDFLSSTVTFPSLKQPPGQRQPVRRLLLLAALAIVAIPGFASAAVIASYHADVASTAQNPTEQGWTRQGDANPNPLPEAGTETIGTKSYAYWNISNTTATGSAYSVYYRKMLAANDFKDPEGWTATIQLRVLQTPTAAGTPAPPIYNSAWFEIRDGVNIWEIGLTNDAINGKSISYKTNDGFTQLTSYDVGADYLTLQLYFNPDTSSVTFFLNGAPIGSPLLSSQVPKASTLRIQFGDADSSGRSGKTDSHWHSVQLETGYAIMIPEGKTTSLLMGGSLLLLAGRFLSRKKRLSAGGKNARK